MSKNIQRVAKLETGLTPKQAILLWFQEAHGFNTIFEYIHHLKSQPDSRRADTQVNRPGSRGC